MNATGEGFSNGEEGSSDPILITDDDILGEVEDWEDLTRIAPRGPSCIGGDTC